MSNLVFLSQNAKDSQIYWCTASTKSVNKSSKKDFGIELNKMSAMCNAHFWQPISCSLQLSKYHICYVWADPILKTNTREIRPACFYF